MVAKIDLMSFRPISPMILAVFLHSWINIASDNRHIISGSMYHTSLLTLLTQSQKRFKNASSCLGIFLGKNGEKVVDPYFPAMAIPI